MTDVQTVVGDPLHGHRTWFLALGIALILLGIVALAYDFLTTIVSVLFFGWVLLIGGVVEIVHSVRTRGWGGVLLHVLSGLLAVIAGLVFIANPVAGALALTLVLGALFLVGGVFRIVGTARFGLPGWGILGGVITALLGLLLLVRWPMTGLWFIGLAVGVDLIFRGWAWVMLTTATGKARP